ncbi:MAG: DNA polymerase III subunit gamma/tau [Bacteroidales bacterium]|nr:DNA polymerase III subunit gamma/tau [Bacteroidales bacterium]MCF8344277.1 DNA polymerase III subunit gamma/tau [Bacteroidales bacterium]MCF8351653.1 DNA polymerase III subunit gamma/tau [Bacteroidales bacterium]MCF8375524.1 DNA polymerase III subunit gamma/tau [Bacteroidales bacterium]MCF8399923.1 DNA polymerase III subunit gamma/tau [Bacteroidales bacterium]
MENFIVSARKYRPATFDSVVGQKSITNTLKNAIRNNQLAQAFLFCGPRGIGKTTCARILAKTINCENLNENLDPCDRCESCISFNKSASFNIHELDAASNNSVDDIRNLVDQVRIPPQVGNYKVYIIDEVHMLSQAAFNAFLKTLEEPPSYAKFILATTEKHKIIPTILSRCQIFDFKRITVEDIAGHLSYVADKEGVEYEQNALHVIAQKADGAMRDALSIFDQIVSFSGKSITYQDVIENLNVLDYDYYFKMVDHFLLNDSSHALLLINKIIENGFDGQHFIIGLGEHLRNLLVCTDEETLQLLEVSQDFKEKYQAQAAKTDAAFILKSLEINNQCDINYKGSNNKRLHLELSILQMCNIINADQGAPEKKSPVVKTLAKPSVKKDVKAEEPAAAYKAKKTEPVKEETKAVENKKIGAMGSAPGTISIKKTASENNKKKQEEQKEENPADKPATKFSHDQLLEAWKSYAEEIKEKYPVFASAMLKYDPKLEDEFTIEFKNDNKIISNDLQKISELLGFLKRRLNNYHIKLNTQLTQKEENQRAYTDQEKFEQMTKKNPSVQKLKNELGLEIDF